MVVFNKFYLKKNRLINDVGIDSLSNSSTLDRAALGAAAGGKLSYDSKTGDITLTQSRTGSNLKRRTVIDNYRK